VPCAVHRGHEVDVVALSRDSPPRSSGGRITLLGEAKLARVRPGSELDRLTHVRELLGGLGWDTTDTRLALFARDGFTIRPEGPLLVDLTTMYC
jgi:uncharacterized protein